jgi:hypothetical protein
MIFGTIELMWLLIVYFGTFACATFPPSKADADAGD